MVKIPGTNVASGITPFSTEDRFPTHYSQYGKGGWRYVETKLELNRIPMERREYGMVVYVKEENRHYTLIGGLDDHDWEELDLGNGKPIKYELNEEKTTWNIKHDLNKYPSVTVTDSNGNTVVPDVQYIDANNILITFSVYPGRVTAYLN